jgi:hypothetical protein
MPEAALPAFTAAQLHDARRKLRKFLRRSAPGLGSPVTALRDPESGLIGFLRLNWERQEPATEFTLASIERAPMLDRRTLDSVIVECRVFILASEDCYLPGVVKALQRLVTIEQARARRPLRDRVGSVIRDGRLVSAEGQAGMYSGRLEMDNGLGPGRLLGSDQITMDYINGVVLHEDENSIQRLANVSDDDSINMAVLIQLNGLIDVVENVRAQVLHDIEVGHFSMEP